MKKLLAVIVALTVLCCAFVGCDEDTVVEEPTATPDVTEEPTATELPDVELEYDKTKFCLDGVVLKSYIGDETNVVIPEGVIIIDDSAFRNCTTVETVTFTDSVTEIGDYAFCGCTSLREISLPALVTTVGDYAFAECTALTTFESKTNTSNIGAYAFYNCAALENITLSKNIVTLNESVFEGCTSVKTLSFNNLKEIKSRAFYGCTSLESITANLLTTIGDYAFCGCTSFADASELKAVTEIGYDVFEGTKWLADSSAKADAPEKSDDAYVIIGKGVLVYYSNVKVASENAAETDTAESSLVELELDSDVKVIAPGALEACAGEVESVKLSTGVVSLGKAAFKDFTKLQYIELSSQITKIPEYAFAGCENLITVIMPGKVETIGDYAFDGCVKLNAVSEDKPKKLGEDESYEEGSNVHGVMPVADFSGSVTSIGDYAFNGCASVVSLKASEKLLSIGTGAFNGCTSFNVENIEESFGKGLSYVGAAAFADTPWFENWNGTEDSNLLIIGNGVLIKAVDYDYAEKADGVNSISAALDGFTAVGEKLFYNSKEAVSIIIPEGVTAIGDYAFYFAENLKYVSIPSTVTSIGANAFYGCKSLEAVVIPDGVTEIADYAFYGCANLTSVSVPESVTKIGKYAFFNCISLGDIAVPAGVTEIGEYAFANTLWVEDSFDKYLVAGDGILIKYNGFEKEIVFTSEDPVVKAVCGGAFEGTYMLEKVTLPDSVKTIAAYAFSGCTTVKEVISTASVVGERAFNNCTSLENADFAGGASVAEDAFNGCTLINESESNL